MLELIRYVNEWISSSYSCSVYMKHSDLIDYDLVVTARYAKLLLLTEESTLDHAPRNYLVILSFVDSCSSLMLSSGYRTG